MRHCRASALDLVVCTHIDDDHIAGIERLYGCLSKNSTCAKDGDKVDGSRLWFNSFSDLLGDAVDIKAALAGVPVQAVAASVGQGENTTRFALACGAEINADAPGTLIAVGQQPKDLQPAKVTIHQPRRTNARRASSKEWLKKVEKRVKKKGPHERAGRRRRGLVQRPTMQSANLVLASLCWWKRLAAASS